ncbi:LysR family transcriptional regulator [Oleomonas cavernae]|uniref:LysR family transcriptional regulator n=1 Tax=Oleomonas cavernae TaxID=2320859 RepID=A0A418WU17_9PROT|nr:LysR substrate-binding domain-containing protein [Oleomonas cavernae]RJF94666.1 LysR family transcriptional regulator [Oleomonas cavernae]
MTHGLGRRLIPPLGLLVAFEAAARLGSFTRAAAELNLTQGAISRQVKDLEERLGLALFERVRQRVALTPAGRFYADSLRETLSRFATATAQTIAFKGRGGTLDLAILPTFGTRWLIPRLPDFFARHRDVTIRFATRLRPFDFAREGLDAAIHFGDDFWPGATLHRLMGEVLVPVAAPALVKRERLAAPADLRRATLLIQATRPKAWPEWFAANDLGPVGDQPTLSFEQFAMVLQAAVAELGVAMVPRLLVAEELARGELQVLFGTAVTSTQGYFLAYPTEKSALPPLAAFRDWLLEKVATETL